MSVMNFGVMQLRSGIDSDGEPFGLYTRNGRNHRDITRGHGVICELSFWKLCEVSNGHLGFFGARSDRVGQYDVFLGPEL